jgi:hypothetical protein
MTEFIIEKAFLISFQLFFFSASNLISSLLVPRILHFALISVLISYRFKDRHQ